jgi:1-acyl-sn-glycerol-3-phosphate acyltransferase
MQARLTNRDSLFLFPEGTSSDGSQVLPFKSSLFSAADVTFPDGQQVLVQPVTLSYSRYDHQPITTDLRDAYAWYGDMTFGGHFWHWLGLRNVGVDVIFHPPVRLSDFSDRKALSKYCHDVISDGLNSALTSHQDI